MFFNLIYAEWIKLSRRPMVLIVLLVFLGLMLLQFIALFVTIGFHDGTLTGGLGTIQFLNDEQLALYRHQLRFPGVFGTVLSQANSIGGICAIVLTAGVLGSEYGWGTLRVQLARAPRRGRYLVAKVIVLLLMLLIGIVIAMVLGMLLGLISGLVLGELGSVGVSHLWLIPLGIARALYVMLPYVMFTVAVSTVGRSVLAGVAGGMIFLILDVGIGTLSFLSEFGGVMAFLYNLFVQQNINTLVVLNSQSFGIDQSVMVATLDLSILPHPAQAIVLVGLYSALFFGYAYYWLTSRDITGAQ